LLCADPGGTVESALATGELGKRFKLQSDQIQPLWSQFRGEFREQTQQMNNGFVFDDQSDLEFSVTKETHNLSCLYHSDTGNIEIRRDNQNLDWLVVKSHLDPSQDYLVSRENKQVNTTSYAATALNELDGGTKHRFLLD
jgi:hypothetical protein